MALGLVVHTSVVKILAQTKGNCFLPMLTITISCDLKMCCCNMFKCWVLWLPW